MNKRNILQTIIITGMIGLFGCGGGGGGTTAPPANTSAAKTTTISGKAEFPSLNSLVAKRVASQTADSTVSIQAYTLEGIPVGTPVTPTYDNTTPGSATDFTKRVYGYVLPNIEIGKDYVIKAKRIENGKTQELKKLIEKAEIGTTPVTEQNLGSVSTAAVVVASQKLTKSMELTTSTITLGDTLPPLGGKTVDNLSEAIVTDVAPKSLEASIQTAKEKVTTALASGNLATALSSMTAEDKKALADLVNMLNIVVAAIANNADPAKVMAGTTASVDLSVSPSGPQLKMITVDTGGAIAQAATATTTIDQKVIHDTVTSTVISYVPPRVKLELSTNATSLSGIIIEVTMPLSARVRTDASGKLDMTFVTVPSGATVDAQFDALTRTIRLAIATSGNLPVRPATFVSLSFDRTAGVILKDTNFPTQLKDTSDNSGNYIQQPNLQLTVTSSGM